MNARELQGRRDTAWGHTAGLIQEEGARGGRQGRGARETGDKSVSPVMRPSAGGPGERLSGCLVVLGARTPGTGTPAPRVTEKHIQEELVFLLTFLKFF